MHQRTQTFEGDAKLAENGVEYVLASDLHPRVGFGKWEIFQTVIAKAKPACEMSGHMIGKYCPDVRKTVEIGSGAERDTDDIMLNRDGCHLIAQHGDLRKQWIALVQTSSKGGPAQDGTSTQAMKTQWVVLENRPVADSVPTIILKAKDSATEITIHNARTHGMSTEPQISREHVTNKQTVRDTLLNRGILLKSLFSAEEVRKVERRLTFDDKKAIKQLHSWKAYE